MKNWKDKILGIFAAIGVMSILMGSYSQQSETEKWMIAVGTAENNELILKTVSYTHLTLPTKA